MSDPPYPGYLERLAQATASDAERAQPLRSAREGAPPPLRDALTAVVEDRAARLVALSHDVHEHPELGFEEHHAVHAVAALLEEHGLACDVGAWGIPTALRARAGHGRPAVAVLAEYDALPDIGHACGHNVICASAVGAFLALAAVIEDLDGAVELIGTPAEEGGGGKELIAQAGGFDEIDAALMLHPASFEVAEHPWIGVRQVEVVYHGRSAHAAAMPFLGRNALDAVVQAYTAMAALRQHMLPSDRVHGVITDGGRKPNIVPERAAATFYLRSAEPQTLRELCERARAIFDAAALATATEVEIRWDPCPVYLPVRNNRPLAARFAENLRGRGRRLLPAGIVPGHLSGSTDLGNVSVRVPAIHPTLQIAPAGVSIHNPEFARYASGPSGDAAVVDGALGLALTAADFLTDAALRDDARAAFDRDGGSVDLDELLS